MAQLGQMIEARRGSLSYNQFAKVIGINSATLFRYTNGERNMSIPNIRKVARWAISIGDDELVASLASYALGLDPEDVEFVEFYKKTEESAENLV